MAQLFPCPDCGGTTPKVHLVLSEQITLRDALKFKGRRPGMKRPIVEGRGGSELHRDSGEWRRVDRKIDRTLTAHTEPWYEETILPLEQGGGPNGALLESHDDERGAISSADLETLAQQAVDWIGS